MNNEPKVDIVDDGVERVPKKISYSNTMYETSGITPPKGLVEFSVGSFCPNAVQRGRDDDYTVNLGDYMYRPITNHAFRKKPRRKKIEMSNQLFFVALLLVP